jgi:hypothetical protein
MPKRSPHLLSITLSSCLLAVSALAAAALTDSLVLVALAFLATLAMTEVVIWTVGEQTDTPPDDDAVGESEPSKSG